MPARRFQILRLAYWIAVVCLFAFAAWRRFSLPLDPIADPDYMYLLPALSKLRGDPFKYTGAVNCIYPGLVYFVVRLFNDFRALTIFQHALGLVAGLLFLVAWNRGADLFADSRLPWAIHRAIGLAGLTIYLFSNHPIVFECQIRPDAICMFLEMLLLWLAIRFFVGRLVTSERDNLFFNATALILVGCVLAAIKPSFTLATLFILTPVIWLTITSNRLIAGKLAVVGVLVVVVLGLNVLQRLFARGEDVDAMFLPQTLFAVHAKIIQRQMAADLTTNESGPTSKEWLRSASAELQQQIETSHVRYPNGFASLGFNPDNLLSAEDALLGRWRDQLGDETFLKFLNYWYCRALLQQPLACVRKILDQLQFFYSSNCPAFFPEKRVPLGPLYYERSFAVLNELEQRLPELWRTPVATAFYERTDQLRFSRVVVEERRVIELSRRLLRRGYLPILLTSVLLASWVLIRRKNRLFLPTFLVFLFYSANFGNVLGISIVHSMDVLRYSTIQFPAALFAELFAIRWLIELFPIRESHQPASRWGRPIQTSAPGE
jgi:hypothetical protein